MRGDDLFFTDTNILLYSADPADPVKQQAASKWLELLLAVWIGPDQLASTP